MTIENDSTITPCFRFKRISPYKVIDFWDNFDKDKEGLFDLLSQQEVIEIKNIPANIKKYLEQLRVPINLDDFETVQLFFQPINYWTN